MNLNRIMGMHTLYVSYVCHPELTRSQDTPAYSMYFADNGDSGEFVDVGIVHNVSHKKSLLYVDLRAIRGEDIFAEYNSDELRTLMQNKDGSVISYVDSSLLPNDEDIRLISFNSLNTHPLPYTGLAREWSNRLIFKDTTEEVLGLIVSSEYENKELWKE